MRKFFPITIIVLFTSLLLFFFGSKSLQPVNAQCGTASSCNTCHQVQNHLPVNTKGDWHINHANYDLCADCHKGNAASTDQTTAHTGVTANLADMGQSCQNCHPDDYINFYAKYAAKLGISTVPQIAAQNPLEGVSSALCATPAGVNPSGNPAKPGSGDTLLVIILAVLILAGAAFIILNETRRRKPKEVKK